MTQPIAPAVIHFNDSDTPVADDFQDVYFSNHNGLEESRYVFLAQNHLAVRFAAFHRQTTGASTFVIGETGFGSGLNFLNVCKLWQQTQPADSTKKLHFISCERYPLSKSDLQCILQKWPSLYDEQQQLINQYPPLIEGIHCLEITSSVTLTLIFDEVVSGFKRLLDLPEIKQFKQPYRLMDAWLLDGFAPAKNPEMWRDEVFQTLAQLSHTQTTLATFTAAGFVNRGLKQAGFDTLKVKGFGHKREIITAVFKGLPIALPSLNAQKKNAKKTRFWPTYIPTERPRHIAIIGAGIAGVTTAKTLSASGFEITLIDKQSCLLGAANPQAVLFPSFSKTDSPLTQFHFHAYLFALRYYQKHFPHAFHSASLLQLIDDSTGSIDNAQAIHQRYTNSRLIDYITSEAASNIANTLIDKTALHYPNAGWINPIELIAADTLQGIHIQAHTQVNSLHYDQRWHLATNHGEQKFDAVILANASDAESLLSAVDPDLAFNTGKIRGQVTQISADRLPSLNAIICHEGYICPQSHTSDNYCLGASYDLKNNAADLSTSSQQNNIQKLSAALPEFQHLHNAELPLTGKVGFRCTTRDYLPVVGPVPKSSDYLKTYDALRHNKNTYIPQLGSYHPNLFVITGLGSKGFSSAPVSAAIINSYLTDGFFPLERTLVSALHPARFLIRAIIQNKMKAAQ